MLANGAAHSSVVATLSCPPAAIALAAPPDVGREDPLYLAVAMLLISVQEEPFHNSVFAVLPGGPANGPTRPPNNNA